MGSRLVSLILLVAIASLQYDLWFGKGSWLRVWEVDRQLSAQREANRLLVARNAGLDAEVRDLKQGFDAIEERARSELGMIRSGEFFFQVLEPPTVPRPAVSTGR